MGGIIFVSGIVILLLISSIFDVKYKKIPNICTLCMLAFISGFYAFNVLFFGFTVKNPELLNHGAGAVLPFLIMLPARALTKKDFGAGDKKLFCVLGAILGVRSMVYFLFLMLLASLVFCIFKKVKRSEHVAMAPFMLISYICVSIIC